MKTTMRLLLIPLLAACLLLPVVTVSAQTPPPPATGDTYQGDRLVVGETFRLNAGDVFNGELSVVGGQLDVDAGAKVNGDITLMGGVLNLDGEVNGDIAAMGATVNLDEDALVSGTITSVGAHISGASSENVRGGINESGRDGIRIGDLPFVFGDRDYRYDDGYDYTPGPFDLLGRMLRDFLIVLAVGALGLLAVVVAPLQGRNVTDTLAAQPGLSLGLGILSLVLLPFVVVLLALLMITIILIPVTLLAYLVIGLILLLAWLASGYYTGRLLERSFKQDWAEPVVAGIGTVAITALSFLVGWIPCLGWLFGVVILSFGLGALILSRLGTQVSRPRPPASGIVPTGPAAPAPPARPVVEPAPDDLASSDAVSTSPRHPEL